MENPSTKTTRQIGGMAVFLFFFVLFIQNPTSVYAGNPREFFLSIRQVLLFLAPAFLGCSLVFLLPILFLRGLVLRVYSLLWLILFLAAWTYSNLVLLDFGVLDGQQWRFDFLDEYLRLEVLGFSTACIILGSLFITKPALVKYSMIVFTSAVFASSIANILSDPKKGIGLFIKEDTTPVYRFSSEKNLLIVLMDTFQSDIFADLVRLEPELAARFDGFTFFPDTLGVAPTTYLTMPSVHSGAEYDTSTEIADFYEKNVHRGSFMNALADVGYEAILISPATFGCPEKTTLCNTTDVVLMSLWSFTLHNAARLLDFSVFRAVPLRYKEWAYGEGRWQFLRLRERYNHFVLLSNKLLQELAERAVVDTGKPTAKFFHLMNTHPPFVMDHDCRFRGRSTSDSRERMVIQAGCAVQVFVKVLERLKALDVYDETVIMLIADTGSGVINVGSSYMGRPGGLSYIGSGLVGGANPILLVKPLGARGPLETSSASVQVSDIAATVCHLLGDCTGFGGTSLFRESEGEHRGRLYNHFNWTNKFIGLEFIPGLVQYRVQGPLWDLESWPLAARPVLRLDEPIDFTGRGHSAAYRGYGWDHSTHRGTYTNGPEATLTCENVENVDTALMLSVFAGAHLDETHPMQEVDVYANDVHVGTWSYERQGVVEQRDLVIPRRVIAQRDTLEIRFKIRYPYREVREDWARIILKRELGLRVRKILFRAVPGA